MHHAIVHTPLKFQGLGIPSLYMTQGIIQLEALIDTLITKENMSSLIQCSAEDLKIEVGLPGHLLQQDYTCVQHGITPVG